MSLTFDEWIQTVTDLPQPDTHYDEYLDTIRRMREAWNAALINVTPAVRDPWKVSGPYRIARTLKVVSDGFAPARLFIDGELFPFATVDGYTVHPRKNEIPGVYCAIAGERVELVHNIDDGDKSRAPKQPKAE